MEPTGSTKEGYTRKACCGAAPKPATAPSLFNCRNAGIFFCLLTVAGILALAGLANHPYWDDEANTALFARALRATGHLSAFNGTNVIGFREGAELDEQLRNRYMPPLQYGVAALGQYLFGDTTFGGRFLFVLAGLAALGVLFLWTHWHFAGRVPAWLPLLITATAPAYLLYIRQCRYYSLTVLLTLGLLALAAAPVVRRSILALVCCLSALCMGLLLFTNYLSAVAAGASLTLLWLLRRYRTRAFAAVFGAAMSAAVLCGIFVLMTANPFSFAVPLKAGITGPARIGILTWWHVTGLGSFEFFPLSMPLLLWLLRRVRRFQPYRALLDEGLFLCLMLVVYSIVVAVFSPQAVSSTRGMADMRYVVPLIAVGSAASAVLIFVIGAEIRPVAVVLLLALLLSNALSLGFIGGRPLRSTLADYVLENLHPYETGTDRLIRYLATLKDGVTVQIIPDFMTYQAMYYVPRLHYVNQLSPQKHLAPGLRGRVPAYVFTGAAAPDYFIVGDIPSKEFLSSADEQYGTGSYRLVAELPGDWHDRSRPEIPWRAFGPPDKSSRHGFLVIARQSEDRGDHGTNGRYTGR